MQDENLSIVFSSSIEDIAPVNSSFDSGIMRIAYWGRNNNKTHISKAAFEAALPTMYNCPIVCNYNRETDSIGSHDVEIVRKNGCLRIVNITEPVGVVPESAKPFWREVEEADGAIHEYLCTPILLWKRQEAYEHIKDNGVTDESMEIRVLSGMRKDDGIFYVDKFEFTAFCLLESAMPCFESAGIEVFSLSEFKTRYATMMDDFKREFSQVSPAMADDIRASESAENFSKGGVGLLDVNELMLRYELTEQDIDFEIDGMDAEEIERRFAEIKDSKDAQSAAEPAGSEPAEGHEGGDGADHGTAAFSLTGEQLLCGLIEALRAVTYTDPDWGELSRYGYVDYDPEAGEVFAYDYLDWKLYGFAYSLDGDNVLIDFASKKRKKIAFVDFDMGSELFAYTAMFSMYESKVEKMSAELESLRSYKLSVESAKRRADEDAVFARFEDLNGDERFEALKNSCSDLEIADIEDKCFAIRGRNIQMKFSQETQPKAQRLPVERNNTNTDEPYGGIFLKYGIGNR